MFCPRYLISAARIRDETFRALTGWEPRLDRLGWWVAAAVLLIVIAYAPFFLSYTPRAVSPGFKLF